MMQPERDALVRPLFFAGQALTDRDLTDLVGWTDRRFALRRLTAGWGVVCGLDVTADPKRPGRLIAGPGYAVDPSGRDLSLAESVWADFEKGPKSESKELKVVGPFKVEARHLAVVDVYLHAAADERRPALVGGNGCSTTCKPTRSMDAAKLVFRPVEHDVKVKEDATLKDLLEAATSVAGSKLPVLAAGEYLPVPALKQFLVDRCKESPEKWLRTFPDLPDWIEERNKGGRAFPSTPWELAEVLGWMIDSYRQMRAVCPPADPKAGVPLARAWFRTNGREPRVLFIRNHPPYRRAFAVDPIGPIDPRRLIGYSYRAARDELVRSSVSLLREQFEYPASLGLLQKELENEAKSLGGSIDPNETLIAIATPDDADAAFASRIVAAYQATEPRGKLTEPSTGLRIEFFKPAPDAMEADWKYDTAPNSIETTRDVPIGGLVTVAVHVENPGEAASYFGVYEDVRRRYVAVAADFDSKKALVATIRLDPPQDQRAPDKPSVTVVLGKANERQTAVSGASKVGLRAFPLSQLPLNLAIPGEEASAVNGEVPLLKDGATQFVVQLRMINNTPSSVRGKLMFSDKPVVGSMVGTLVADVSFPSGATKSVPGILTDVKNAIATEGDDKLKLPTDRAWYFWLDSVTDEFHQPLSVLPNRKDTSISFRTYDATMQLEVAGGDLRKLVIANNEPISFEVTELNASVGGIAVPATAPQKPVLIPAKGKAEIGTVEAATGAAVKAEVKFKINKSLGVANFTAISPGMPTA